MDDHAVADQAHLRATLDLAFRYTATGNLADLRDIEDLLYLRIAKEDFTHCRREQTGHGRLNVIYQIVDNVVVADLDTITLRVGLCLSISTHVEPDDHGACSIRKPDVAFVDRANA